MNRPGRVQISCDEEIYGARIKVKLPFIAGVIANLTGLWRTPVDKLTAQLEEAKKKNDKEKVNQLTRAIRARGELEKREFVDIHHGNFPDVMEMMEPSVSFNVPNTVTGEDNLSVSLTFSKMEDFSPDRVAEQVEDLKPLLEARNALNELRRMAVNKGALEKLLQRVLEKPELAKALLAASRQKG